MNKYSRQSNTNDKKRYDNKYRGGGRNKKPRSWTPPPNLSPYEKSVWLKNSFTGKCIKRRHNESSENMLRRFKKSVENSGVIREMKRREYYMSKSERRRDKRKRALKRLRKRLKYEQFLLEQEEKKDLEPRDPRGPAGRPERTERENHYGRKPTNAPRQPR